MPVKSPNHYGDRGRQTAADAAGRAANCSCNWTYFTQASENLACLTAALVRSLHPLFLLLLSSPLLANSALLSLTHTAIIGGVFSLSAETPESLGHDQPVITASSESHPRDTVGRETWHGPGFLRMDWETWRWRNRGDGPQLNLVKPGNTILSFFGTRSWKTLHENWTLYCFQTQLFLCDSADIL